MGKRKIITPDIASHASFSLDEKGDYTFVSGYGITLKDETNYNVLSVLDLLNSALLDFYYKKISTKLQHGFYRYFSQYLEKHPIPIIDFNNPTEKSAHDGIVRRVEQILGLHKQRQALDPAAHFDEIRSLERRIQRVDKEIDRLVYGLYGLTEEEIKIVEGG